MISKKFVAAFLGAWIAVPAISLFVGADLPIFVVFVVLLVAVIGYILEPRYRTYNSLNDDSQQMVEVEGEIVSEDTTKSPFLGEDCVACSWDIYEWSSNIFSKRDTWVQAATGANFADDIRVESDGQEYEVAFEDISKSRKTGKFFSKQKIGGKPLTGVAGTRIHGTSVEFTSGVSTVEVDANEKPSERIQSFLDKLKTDMGPTDKTSMIFDRKEGDRKYTESRIDLDETVFVRGKETQSDEFGVKKIVPTDDSMCVFTNKSKQQYFKEVEASVQVLLGFLAFGVTALIASGVAWYTGFL